MAHKDSISQTDFDLLLAWFDPSPETAAAKYERIRQGLIRIFQCRGCHESEDLADTTFNRVIQKLSKVCPGYEGNPALYFYGVANNVHREWLRKQRMMKNVQPSLETVEERLDADVEYQCLEKCLDRLPATDRSLIVDYYRDEKRAKIERRRGLAERLHVTSNGLQIKASRIRQKLRSCIEKCVSSKKVERFSEPRT
jgi:RNA polymerase sigma factor (sigma-70 family)